MPIWTKETEYPHPEAEPKQQLERLQETVARVYSRVPFHRERPPRKLVCFDAEPRSENKRGDFEGELAICASTKPASAHSIACCNDKARPSFDRSSPS